MNIQLYITEVNQPEVRRASRSVDEQEERQRQRAFWRFVGEVAFLVLWSFFWSFVLWGWVG